MEKTTCSRGHEEITFAGAFWVLCPLCAQIEKTAEAIWSGEDDVKTAVAAAEDAGREELRESAKEYQDQIDTLKEGIAELEKALKEANK
jgi:hypothetical protein